MTPVHEVPLTNEAAWLDGTWVRTRSGPTRKARTPHVDVSIWHKVGGFDAHWNRLLTACGFGPRNGLLWPSMGGRMEIARPGLYVDLPGSVCPRCRETPPVVTPDEERIVPDEIDIDRLATLVAEHLLAKNGEPRD